MLVVIYIYGQMLVVIYIHGQMLVVIFIYGHRSVCIARKLSPIRESSPPPPTPVDAPDEVAESTEEVKEAFSKDAPS